MKKVLSLIAILCLALVCFAGCDMFNKPTETPCEHEWADATCTAPKTCSLCGATDGEALGHTEEIVAGTAATCTESGMTDGKKCTVCGETTVEQTAISALGHTEETVAGTPATCTDPGKTDGKKCSVCGVTTVEQTAIDALGHKAGNDDGDVTTAVKCENEGCDYIFVEAKEAITLTIPTFENGTVVADKKNYAIGDTVKLTINPEFECAQKLYINDEPIILGWNTNVYSFVAEEDTYVISGSFEPSINMTAGDETRWDYINQAHGIVTTYYPNNNDAWWFKVNGNYSSFSINAKNYREVANSYENGPDGGWRIALFMQLDNGEYYAFSMWIDANHKYAYNHFGGKIAGEKDSITTWGGAWHDLAVTNAEATAALNGDGAEFKLERIDGNHIRVSFGGIVLETYEIAGVTAENKVVSVGLHHWGNKGSYVDIPFAVTDACEHDWQAATCTAPKTCSKCNVTVGAVIDHTYENYVSDDNATCTEDGTKTGTCVCGAKDTIVDEGSKFGHNYDDGVETTAPTCTEKGVKTFTCKNDASHQYTEEIPANGHKDNDNNYKCDVCGANLCTSHDSDVTISGTPATCTESGLTDGKQCSKCGEITVSQQVIPAKGHTANADDGNCATALVCANGCGYIFVGAMNHDPEVDDGDVTTAVKCANAGCEQILVPAKEAIALNIPAFENGAVSTDKKNYAAGDTVTLIVSADKDYAQKLYINDEPIILDWNTNVYSFVAEEDTYVISGSFEPAINMTAGDKGRWDYNNQAHGIVTTYYPNNDDAWWFQINGDYKSFSINAKNYKEVANSYEGIPGGQGWAVVLYMKLDNGNYYAFRMWIDANKIYAYQHFGGKVAGDKDSTTGWSGAWRNLAEWNAEATAALNGDGAEFKLERIDGNHIQVTFGGVVLETYEIPGVTAENKVVAVGLHHWGNKGSYVEIPFAVTVPTPVKPEPPVTDGAVILNIGEFANGTVAADKASYNVGDTVTLSVTPNSGYFQKIYINGDPVMLGWKTFTYSFVATENVYNITGSFERSLEMYAGDWNRWDNYNHAHGIVTTYYPNENDGWWFKIKGDYDSFAVTAKNYREVANSYEGSANGPWRIVLYMQFDNGEYYAFTMWIDAEQRYVYNHCDFKIAGDKASVTGSGGAWRNLVEWNAEATAALNGDGAEFKLERIDGNHIQVSFGGTVIETYEISGVTAENKVVSVGLHHYGNRGSYVDIPFEVK